MCRTPNNIFLVAMATLSLASGCRQSPWEELSPQYTKETVPPVYKFRDLYPAPNSIWTSDGKRLWAVGDSGKILESDDSETWKERTSNTRNDLYSIFGTSDGERLWAVGRSGRVVESDDGKHWKVLNSGTTDRLHSIFGTRDGKRLWAVGDHGTILESEDGEHWNQPNRSTARDLHSIFGTSDGK